MMDEWINWIKGWWMNESTELKDDELINELNKSMMKGWVNKWMNWIELKDNEWINQLN